MTRPRRSRAWAGTVAVAVVAASPARGDSVTGTVFHDFNTNGVRDGDPARGAVDLGVGGLTVRALRGTHTVVDTATTAPDGSYTLNAPDGRARIDLTVPLPWWPTRQLNGLRSDEQFVDASRPLSGVDFGVHHPREWSVNDPPIAWPTQRSGPVDGSNADRDAIRGMHFFTTPAANGTFANEPTRRGIATFRQVGSLFGLGIDQRTGTIYAGAFYKRFSGLTRHGTGAIFRVDPAGDVTLWADLPAGSDRHPTGSEATDWFRAVPNNRDLSWDLVGKRRSAR